MMRAIKVYFALLMNFTQGVGLLASGAKNVIRLGTFHLISLTSGEGEEKELELDLNCQ